MSMLFRGSRFLGSSFAGVPLLLLTAVAPSSHAEVVSVRTTGALCRFAINSVGISNATLVGERRDLILLLSKYADLKADSTFSIHSCAYLLSDHGDLTEVEYFIQQHAKPVQPGHAPDQAISRVVVIEIASPREFIQIARSRPAPAAATATEDPTPPSKPPPTNTNPRDPTAIGAVSENACTGEGEICLSTDGTAELGLSCGPLSVSLRTNGAVSIGFESNTGPIDFSLNQGVKP